MEQRATNQKKREVLLTLAGLLLLGFLLGLPHGPAESVTRALALPAVLVGIAMLMLPTIYILTAITNTAPEARSVVRGTASALSTTGTAALGFVLPLAFLTASAPELTHVLGLSTVALLVAVTLGLRRLYGALFESAPDRRRALPIYLAWSGLCLGIGSHVLHTTFTH